MPTHHDETLPQRYEREHQAYLKLCGSMTAEQVADLQLQLNNSLAREQALQALLTAADERADVLEGLLQTINAKASKSHISQSLWRLKTDMANIAQVTEAALKPAEGRNEPNCLRCLDKKTVPSNLAEGYVMDCPDCCSEEG
ncbi:hypothetical protein JFT58_23895 [Pseudomonas sp. MF6767]|uniref:hypothetical protein n=1 Tax=Pseudomonas sp. MF6767 TaxID=2797531 RepID=UPI0018E8E4FA|nr:hypothetical protein [Pseudomonas sp. MF6767]MBJ2281332.1 hypothetical protein [Pseudomonas sp. MF6767]